MRSMGPLWGIGITIDRDLLLVLLTSNLLCAVVVVFLYFRRRGRLEQALLGLGLFTLISALSLIALYQFARAPVHDLQVFVVD